MPIHGAELKFSLVTISHYGTFKERTEKIIMNLKEPYDDNYTTIIHVTDQLNI